MNRKSTVELEAESEDLLDGNFAYFKIDDMRSPVTEYLAGPPSDIEQKNVERMGPACDGGVSCRLWDDEAPLCRSRSAEYG